MSDRHSRFRAVLLAFFVLTAPALVAPVLATPWPRSDIPPDPAVTFGELPNGMRYAIQHNATPSGASAATGALVTYAALTGSERHREAASRALAQVSPLFLRHVRFAGWAAAVGEALLAGPAEVAVVNRPDLERVARLGTSPGAVVVTAGPLTEGRDRPGVYVCRNFVCALPAATADRIPEGESSKAIACAAGQPNCASACR